MSSRFGDGRPRKRVFWNAAEGQYVYDVHDKREDRSVCAYPSLDGVSSSRRAQSANIGGGLKNRFGPSFSRLWAAGGQPGLHGAMYNVDTGHKKNLATTVRTSGPAYSSLRSRVKRFAPKGHEKERQEVLGQLNYDVRQGTLVDDMRRCPVTYKGAFESEDPRFRVRGTDPGMRRRMLELDFYVPDALNKMSFATAAAKSPFSISSMRSQTAQRDYGGYRDPHLTRSLRNMKFYDVEYGDKASLVHGVRKSPLKYTPALRSPVMRFKREDAFLPKDEIRIRESPAWATADDMRGTGEGRKVR